MKNYIKVVLIIIATTLLGITCRAHNVDALYNNIKDHQPLIEYSDPINYVCEYLDTTGGKWESFITNWNLSAIQKVFMSDTYSQHEYERLLIDLLSRPSFVKDIIEFNDSLPNQEVDNMFDFLSDVIPFDDIKGKLESAGNATKIYNVMMANIEGAVKKDILQNATSIEILSMIYLYTDDGNLKKACERCFSYFYSKSYKAILDTGVKYLIDKGIEKGEKYIEKELLKKGLSKSYTSFLGHVSSVLDGFGWAFTILDIKDFLAAEYGVTERQNKMNDILGLTGIHQGLIKVYRTGLNNYLATKNEELGKGI